MAELKPIHTGLVPLAEERFTYSEAPYQLVTFLNRTLKKRGLIFGLRQIGPEQYCLSIYDTTEQGSLPTTAPGKADAPTRTAGAPAELPATAERTE